MRQQCYCDRQHYACCDDPNAYDYGLSLAGRNLWFRFAFVSQTVCGGSTEQRHHDVIADLIHDAPPHLSETIIFVT
jgi:hypothetical protein